MDGIILLNKPKGISSSRAVEKVRKKLKTKVGHTGTLDPLATGLLILLVGRATRFSWLFLNMDKSYEVTALLGISTDTYDVEGKVFEEKEVKVSCEDVAEAIARFEGEILQLPPPYSAKKVSGKRAYKLARKGVKPDLKPVKVRVYRIEMISCNIPEFKVSMRVSSGTYVRSLIKDIGDELSCGGAVKDLVRTSVGAFHIESSVQLEEFLSSEDPEQYVMPIDKALSFLPPVEVDTFHAKKVLHGNEVLLCDYSKRGDVRIYMNGEFLGVGRLEGGILKPLRLIPPDRVVSS